MWVHLGPITAFQLNYALFVGIRQVGRISLSRFGELKDKAFPASRPRGFLLADFPTRYRVEGPRGSTDLRATLPEVCEGYGRPKNFGVVATFIAGVLWVADIYLGEFTRVFKSSLLPLYG